jgi:outer membrane receptor protein involved in Fe transport
MRVNYSDATISGIDLNLNYQPINRMNIFAYYTYMNIQANQGDIEIKHLIQKPEMLAGISAYYNFAFGIKPQFEIEYTGTFYDSDPENDGEFLEIEPTTLFNLRLSYSFAISNIFTEVFVRVNNITDEYKLSQLGLPAAGRTFSGGVSIKL